MNTKITDRPIRVTISGGAGQISYSLIPLIASGSVFGETKHVTITLLDITPMMLVLEGVKMEIEDCLYPLLDEIKVTDSHETAFTNSDYVILLGGFPRKKGMKRSELLNKNAPIFVEMGKALSKYANKNVKVLVVANPANTNALVLINNSSIQKENVTALSRLDLNRSLGYIKKRIKENNIQIKNAIIWGNHSSTQVPDLNFAKINKELVMKKLNNFNLMEFMENIRMRGAEVIKKRGLSSAMSAANAIKDHIQDWYFGTKSDEYTCMCVHSDGNPYGIKDGLIFSFPVVINDGNWEFVKDLNIDKKIKAEIMNSEKELIEERESINYFVK